MEQYIFKDYLRVVSLMCGIKVQYINGSINTDSFEKKEKH